MRIRVNKLVYLPLGGALGAGLLVSAFVAPQPKLAASSECYGVCHSATMLSLSRDSITVGQEALVEFRATVTGNDEGSGKPTGTVEVDAGDRFLCRFDLSDGAGHCSVGNRDLAPDSYDVTAYYSGDSNFDPSTSNTERLEVLRSNTGTALSLSRSSVRDGSESDEEFHVSVSADMSGLGDATGVVDVDAGDKVLCHVDLSGGEGHCYLGDSALAPGGYEIQAHYQGDTDLSPSGSPFRHLDVLHR